MCPTSQLKPKPKAKKPIKPSKRRSTKKPKKPVPGTELKKRRDGTKLKIPSIKKDSQRLKPTDLRRTS